MSASSMTLIWLAIVLAIGSMVVASSATTETSSESVENSTEEQQSVRDVYQVLTSIEDKLKPLEVLLDQPLSTASPLVTWFQGTLIERLARRVDAVEAKLEHIGNRIETRLDKIEEMGRSTWGQSVDSVDSKLDKATDKMVSNMDSVETKIGLQLESWSSKLDGMERRVENDVSNVVNRLSQLELAMERLGDRTSDVTNHKGCQNELVIRLKEIQDHHKKLTDDVNRSNLLNVTSPTDGKGSQQSHKDPWSNAMAADDTPSTISNADWANVTLTLNEAVVIGGKKFQKLDNDIEIYTRKVLNAYQELLKESKEVKEYLNKVIDHDNQTKMVVREGFRKLFQQIKPLTTLEEILHSLLKKVLEMGSTVDTSFASLLVAQNTFIASCHRIQQQEPMIETKIYHLLLKLIKDMEEKSSGGSRSNVTTLMTSFESHRKDVGRALHDLVWTVISVGNQTVEELKNVFETSKKIN